MIGRIVLDMHIRRSKKRNLITKAAKQEQLRNRDAQVIISKNIPKNYSV